MISFGANYSANDTEVNKDGTEVNNENKNIEKIENKSFIKNVDLIVSTVIMIIGIIIIMFSLWFWSNKKSNLKMFLIFIGFLSIIIPNIINLISFADNNSDSNLFLKQLLQNKDSTTINNNNSNSNSNSNSNLTNTEREELAKLVDKSMKRLRISNSKAENVYYNYVEFMPDLLNEFKSILERLAVNGLSTKKQRQYLDQLQNVPSNVLGINGIINITINGVNENSISDPLSRMSGYISEDIKYIDDNIYSKLKKGNNSISNSSIDNNSNSNSNNNKSNRSNIEKKSYIKNINLIVSAPIMIMGIITIIFSLWFWSNKKSNLKMFLIFIGFLSIIIPNIINLISFADNNSDSNLFLKQLLQNKDSINNNNSNNNNLTNTEREELAKLVDKSMKRLRISKDKTTNISNNYGQFMHDLLNEFKSALEQLITNNKATEKQKQYYDQLKDVINITINGINQNSIGDPLSRMTDDINKDIRYIYNNIYLKLTNSNDNAKNSNK